MTNFKYLSSFFEEKKIDIPRIKLFVHKIDSYSVLDKKFKLRRQKKNKLKEKMKRKERMKQ